MLSLPVLGKVLVLVDVDKINLDNLSHELTSLNIFV